jgi:hypothetical protein
VYRWTGQNKRQYVLSLLNPLLKNNGMVPFMLLLSNRTSALMGGRERERFVRLRGGKKLVTIKCQTKLTQISQTGNVRDCAREHVVVVTNGGCRAE